MTKKIVFFKSIAKKIFLMLSESFEFLEFLREKVFSRFHLRIKKHF